MFAPHNSQIQIHILASLPKAGFGRLDLYFDLAAMTFGHPLQVAKSTSVFPPHPSSHCSTFCM